MIRKVDTFVRGNWADALQKATGQLADAESLLALKDLVNALGSETITLDSRHQDIPAHGADFRSNYPLNSTIAGIEQANALLLIGTNPRHEAAVMNVRILKSFVYSDLNVGLVGAPVDLAYNYEHIGANTSSIDAISIQNRKTMFMRSQQAIFLKLCLLFTSATTAMLELSTPPGATYTKKNAIYANIGGRPQMTRGAVPPLGAAHEDWKILRALQAPRCPMTMSMHGLLLQDQLYESCIICHGEVLVSFSRDTHRPDESEFKFEAREYFQNQQAG
ncbi:MAG: Molybdopterin oxidoreductase-domain-containing protein [Podila humilis]|nr:MAG: Molybdopterin oxidoreductase-domain-containing protein [Podila humilis]